MPWLCRDKFAFVVTKEGRIGGAYECVQPGDIIAALDTLNTPCILRPEVHGRVLESGYVTSEISYRFLGTCGVSKNWTDEEMRGCSYKDIDLV